MSIELDWQIVEENVPQQDERIRRPPPKPRRRLSRKGWIALASIVTLIVGAVAAYMTWTYRTQLDRASREIHPVARLEAQAIAANDRAAFLALQDPTDADWRAVQDKRFGRLERDGLPELGWTSTGIPDVEGIAISALPQFGSVTLEPGGATLDVMYQFQVTHPISGGPTSIRLRVPQFYRQTPSGWVHGNPTLEYWGSWQHRSSKYFAMRYTRRDASVLDGLIPYMDKVLSRVCGPLPCPPQPVYVLFENSPEALARLTDFSYGFDDHWVVLKLPSPHLIGVPADARSRDELYRMIGTRVVQALVTEASDRRLNFDNFPPRLLLQWELAKAGLADPFITPELGQSLVSPLQAGTWLSLSSIALRARSAAMTSAEDVAMVSLAFAFLEKQMGAGAVERLIPAMQANVMLGDAIRSVWKVNPNSLEPAWLAYLRTQAGLPTQAVPPLPGSQLALLCAPGTVRPFSIWLRQVNDAELSQIIEGQDISLPEWSPDGKYLAFLQSGRAFVADAETRKIQALQAGPAYSGIGWLPDGRLRLDLQNAPGGLRSHVVNLETHEDIEIFGTNLAWSSDGTRVAYLDLVPAAGIFLSRQYYSRVLIADSNGRYPEPIGTGSHLAWSPDGRRLAFVSSLAGRTLTGMTLSTLLASEIQVADVSSNSVTTLARAQDLAPASSGNQAEWLGNLAWSPDGSLLAAALNQPGGLTLSALDTSTGAVRAQWRGTSARWISLAWSVDSRYVGFWVVPLTGSVGGTVGVLNVETGRTVTLPGRDFDWSPDGKWLAVPQDPEGVFVITPDLSAMRWLDTPSCLGVAWRPRLR